MEPGPVVRQEAASCEAGGAPTAPARWRMEMRGPMRQCLWAGPGTFDCSRRARGSERTAGATLGRSRRCANGTITHTSRLETALCTSRALLSLACAEVPLDDERSACGCTTIVFGGLRMQMPEKIFGNNWFELQHAERGVAISFDCAGALQRWALGSLALVDDRRAGRSAFSGWTCDAAELQEAWQQSAWGAITNYSRREEWDCARRPRAAFVKQSPPPLSTAA